MANDDCTLDTVVQQFGLEVREETDYSAGVTPAPVSAWLTEYSITQPERVVGIPTTMMGVSAPPSSSHTQP